MKTIWIVMLTASCLVTAQSTKVPPHLVGEPTAMYAREGEVLKDAPPEDIAVARNYAHFANKGTLFVGKRITIMTAKTTYRVGEEVRVIHILEAPGPGHQLFVMGPKGIWDEIVDGRNVMPYEEKLRAYNGMVDQSPGVDFNFEVTTYTFTTPGVHTIQWRGTGLWSYENPPPTSNILNITVVQ